MSNQRIQMKVLGTNVVCASRLFKFLKSVLLRRFHKKVSFIFKCTKREDTHKFHKKVSFIFKCTKKVKIHTKKNIYQILGYTKKNVRL